jgi:hypothetical protein
VQDVIVMIVMILWFSIGLFTAQLDCIVHCLPGLITAWAHVVFEILNPDFAFKKRKNLIRSKPSSRSLCFNANFPGPSRLRDEGFERTYVKQFHDHYEYYA